MLKQNKKDKQQDGHRWLLIGFLCLFAVCLVAQVKPTGQTKKAETPAAKTPNGTKQTDKDIKKEPENKKTKVYLLHANQGQADKACPTGCSGTDWECKACVTTVCICFVTVL